FRSHRGVGTEQRTGGDPKQQGVADLTGGAGDGDGGGCFGHEVNSPDDGVRPARLPTGSTRHRYRVQGFSTGHEPRHTTLDRPSGEGMTQVHRPSRVATSSGRKPRTTTVSRRRKGEHTLLV